MRGRALDLCGTYSTDPDVSVDPPAVGDLVSPCDAVHGVSSNPLTASVYLLPSLVGDPGVPLANFAGAAALLSASVVPYKPEGEDECSGCDARTGLTFTELTSATTGTMYATSFKTGKKGKFAVPAESWWQIIVFIDIDQSGPTLPVEVATRIVKVTDTPNTDVPNDWWSRDVQLGSNVPINLVLADDNGCLGSASGVGFVQCLLNLGNGGAITLNNTQLVIGGGSEGGLTVVTGTTDCDGVNLPAAALGSGETNPLDADELLDIPIYGDCRKFTFDPPLAAGEKLQNSCILFEGGDNPFPVTADRAVTVHMIDQDGVVALPPVEDPAAECNPPPTIQQDGFRALWESLVGLFGATPAVATSATTVSHGSSGGSLDDFKVGSEFIIARPSDMTPQTPLQVRGAPGENIPVELLVLDHGSDNVEGATVRFFADAATGGAVSCDGGPLGASCTNTTGADGLAQANWVIGTETTKLWALGCGIAVDVLDAANEYPDGSIPGPGFPSGDGPDGYPCDRDPADVEGGDGYPNGPEGDTTTPVNDAFMPGVVAAPDTPVWLNDLPVEFIAESFVECSPEDADVDDNGDIRFCGFSSDGTVVTFQMLVEGEISADFQYRLTVTNPEDGSTTIKLNDLTKVTTSKGLKLIGNPYDPASPKMVTFSFDAAKIRWDGESELLYEWFAQKGTAGEPTQGFPDTTGERSTADDF